PTGYRRPRRRWWYLLHRRHHRSRPHRLPRHRQSRGYGAGRSGFRTRLGPAWLLLGLVGHVRRLSGRGVQGHEDAKANVALAVAPTGLVRVALDGHRVEEPAPLQDLPEHAAALLGRGAAVHEDRAEVPVAVNGRV